MTNITLCCLFVFDIRILIAPLISSNSSYIVRDKSVVALLNLYLIAPSHDSGCVVTGSVIASSSVQ